MLIIFIPGMTGNAWFDNTDLPRSPGGLVQADEMCRVGGWGKVYVAGDAGSFPGPDWMPKQAHMADLQGTTAAQNLIAELAGRQPRETFKAELICIIDAGDRGTLVMRTPDRSIMLPPLMLMHSAQELVRMVLPVAVALTVREAPCVVVGGRAVSAAARACAAHTGLTGGAGSAAASAQGVSDLQGPSRAQFRCSTGDSGCRWR